MNAARILYCTPDTSNFLEEMREKYSSGRNIHSLHYDEHWNIISSLKLMREMNYMDCKHISIIWPPKSKKSSISRQLCIDHPEFMHLSIWDFFRRDVDNFARIDDFRNFCMFQEFLKWRLPYDYINKTYSTAKKINSHFKESLENGNLIDYKLYRHYITFVLNEVTAWISEDTRLILDWFVRQRKAMTVLRKYFREDWVEFFNFCYPSWKVPVPNSIRMFDEVSWKTFPPWFIINPETWKLLTPRLDDNTQVFSARVKDYEIHTTFAVEHQSTKWAKITDVDVEKRDFWDVYDGFRKKLWLII